MRHEVLDSSLVILTMAETNGQAVVLDDPNNALIYIGATCNTKFEIWLDLQTNLCAWLRGVDSADTRKGETLV